MNIQLKRRLPVSNPRSEMLIVMKFCDWNQVEKYFRKQILLGKWSVLLVMAFTNSFLKVMGYRRARLTFLQVVTRIEIFSTSK